MKKLTILASLCFVICTSCTTNFYEHKHFHYYWGEHKHHNGEGYEASKEAALKCAIAGDYRQGSKEWQIDHDEFIEHGTGPMSEGNRSVDGDAYKDSVDAGSTLCIL